MTDAPRNLSDVERRHRNELAARTLTPVPGMDSWLHDVLREARRQRYREAALQGLSANTLFDISARVLAEWAFDQSNEMMRQESKND